MRGQVCVSLVIRYSLTCSSSWANTRFIGTKYKVNTIAADQFLPSEKTNHCIGCKRQGSPWWPRVLRHPLITLPTTCLGSPAFPPPPRTQPDCMFQILHMVGWWVGDARDGSRRGREAAAAAGLDYWRALISFTLSRIFDHRLAR